MRPSVALPTTRSTWSGEQRLVEQAEVHLARRRTEAEAVRAPAARACRPRARGTRRTGRRAASAACGARSEMRADAAARSASSRRMTSAKVLLKPSGSPTREAERAVALAHDLAAPRAGSERAGRLQDVASARCPCTRRRRRSGPRSTASWQSAVPPRFSRRSTGEAARARERAARISPSTTCSVKFLEPRPPRGAPRPAARIHAPPSARATGDRRPARPRRARGGGSARPRASRPSAASASTAAGIAPGQDQARVHGGEAAEDVGAEAARADGGGDGGRAHRDHRRDAHAGQDHGQRQRQLDQAQALAGRHAHAGGRLAAPRGSTCRMPV